MKNKTIEKTQYPHKKDKKSGPGWIRTSDPTIMSRLR
jgi:hypothetical protein